MGENRLVVDHLKLSYTGIFSPKDLIDAIGNWAYEHTMEKQTKKLVEQDTPKGKFIEWEVNFWTKVTEHQEIVLLAESENHHTKKWRSACSLENIFWWRNHTQLTLVYYMSQLSELP